MGKVFFIVYEWQKIADFVIKSLQTKTFKRELQKFTQSNWIECNVVIIYCLERISLLFLSRVIWNILQG